MKFRELTREELEALLTDGVPMPESALINEKTIELYFSELEAFINLAENDYIAEIYREECLKIVFGLDDEVYLRLSGNNILILMSPEMAENYEDMTTLQAESIIGIVYGLIVYNEKWREMSKLAETLESIVCPSFSTISKNNDYKTIPNRNVYLQYSNLKTYLDVNRKYPKDQND